MAWATTSGSTGLSFLPKVAKGLFGLGGLGASGLWLGKDWLGEKAKQYPGLIGSNPLLALGAMYQGAKEGGFESGITGWGDKTPTGYPKHASGNIKAFQESMKDSIKKASTEDDEEDDPFNYNQLFLASILKGLKEKQPKTASGKAAGTYIPRPDLPKMSDYDSNKTYWNIG